MESGEEGRRGDLFYARADNLRLDHFVCSVILSNIKANSKDDDGGNGKGDGNG